jgi:hypothetical protein
MRLRKVLLWAGGGFAGLLALAFIAVHVADWRTLEKYETIIVVENQSAQPIHNLEIIHNGEVVSRLKRLGSQETFALSGLNPLKGPEAKPPSTDIRLATAHAAIAFQRAPNGPEVRFTFDAGGHHLFPDKCLIIIAITSQSVGAQKCVWMKTPKPQAKPKN